MEEIGGGGKLNDIKKENNKMAQVLISNYF